MTWASDTARSPGASARPSPSADSAAATATPGGPPGRQTAGIVRNGVAVDYSIEPAGPSAQLTAGEMAHVRFRVSDATTRLPLRGSLPGAWIDMANRAHGRDGETAGCRDKVGLYLKGVVGIRPMIDLNSSFVVLMNDDASLSVVDPTVSMGGATSTFASIALNAPGADWVTADAQRRLYVSQPRSGQVAVIDTESFRLVGHVAAGRVPVRVALQPDGRYLWVGNNSDDAASGGVSVIDTATLQPARFVATGRGHHEIVFTPDSRLALVTNRQSGTVSMIDVASLAVVAELNTGPLPIAIAFSALSQAAYVADGRDGTITVIDAQRRAIRGRIVLEEGLGPLRTTPDGRFVLALNPQQDRLHVIDVATAEVVQRIAVPGEPVQLAFSDSYAYVRALHAEQVRMIGLASLGRGREPRVQSFSAGSRAPGMRESVVIADGIATALGEGSVFVVNPADGTTYFYMEGMNAPSSNYRVHGSNPRAVTTVDRSLREVEPGVFGGRVRLPVAGSYDVAFMLQTPQLLHCFEAVAAANPRASAASDGLRIEHLTVLREYRVGESVQVRVRLLDGQTGEARNGLAGVRLLAFVAPGRRRTEVAMTEVSPGLYEAALHLPEAGAWYVHVGVPSMRLGYQRLAYLSLLAEQVPGKPAAAAAAR